ncbi:MAG: NUDIX domain-containing protein [Alphaproteobacteria bacterium]|nr:NUDIX domain-containing protein [Alphaproteobacteria bacterium]
MPDRPMVHPADAASLVILRGAPDAPEVLLGRRRDNARFMPGVYVFPGGAVDPPDVGMERSADWPGTRFHAAAIRETWEETGVMIAEPGPLPSCAPTDDPFYAALSESACVPSAGALHYIARAITPEPSPIRFDTRFFLAKESATSGIAHAVGELPEVLWLPASHALQSDRLRGVTKFVLGQALELWQDPDRLQSPSRPVRVFTWADGTRLIRKEPQDAGLL